MTNSSKPKSNTVGKMPTSSAKNSNDLNASKTLMKSEALNETKHCPTCETTKDINLFYKHRGYRDGYKRQCKSCEGNYARLKYEKAKATGETYIKDKKKVGRSGNLRRTFGITVEQYDELLEGQGHCCAICKRHRSEFKINFAVDHAHTESKTVPAGMIRGLLCWSCNRQLIGDRTNADLYEEASRYLRQHTGLKVPEAKIKPKRKRRKRKVT